MKKIEGVAIVKDQKAVKIYLDSRGADYDGLSLAARALAGDIHMVTGVRPLITTDIRQADKTVVVAGSVGNNDFIDSLIGKGVVEVSQIRNKRECYRLQVVEHPAEGIDRAVIIAGSDKRGTIYGIYDISELIGVSPWVYWGDVTPARSMELVLPESKLNRTSREPSVKYRGIFLNDEWPSLGTWVTNKFGGFNEEFYGKVFELILRLKGNYLWPAMWSAVFSEDGKRRRTANARLADAYGIVMGTSHHEAMFRSGEEWQRIYKEYGTSNLWDFAHNRDAITRFWEDAVIRNKAYENLITLGMRGERDSALGGDLQENIDLLKDIITTQKELLGKYGIADAPQVLTLYKEVEKFWYGTDAIPGLKDWELLNDVTVMLAEDNFGNLRTLPEPEERNRKAGWGMYYHFDYHGGPRSYEWVNTVPIEKVWEQMSMAYDYGIRDIWIVNVGDLKPMEFPISYFLDLAYDFDAWGTRGINKTKEYTRRWVCRQFANVTGKDTIDGITDILSDYTRMNGIRKPEVLTASTFSITNYKEAEVMLEKAIALEQEAKKYYDLMPKDDRDAYYQLVFYPAAASANIVKLQIYAGLNQYYHKLGSVLANRYAKLAEDAIRTDRELQSFYNDTMSDGKWQGIMSSPHIGYTNWNSEGWRYPEINYVTPISGAFMIVDAEAAETGYTSGAAELPPFTSVGKESSRVTVSNGGDTEFTFEAAAPDWIKIDTKQGTVREGITLQVSVDWDHVAKKSAGILTITGNGQKADIKVTAEIIDTSGIPEMFFPEINKIISIEAEHTLNRVPGSGAEWRVIENYGRTLSSVKMFPATVSFERTEEAPYLEYGIHVYDDGEYMLTVYTAPTNNLSFQSRLRYGISFDGAEPVIADSLPADYAAGNYNNKPWCDGVLDNIHISAAKHHLAKGAHILRFHGLDAGLVLQKLVLSRGFPPASYLGPPESAFL